MDVYIRVHHFGFGTGNSILSFENIGVLTAIWGISVYIIFISSPGKYKNKHTNYLICIKK